MAMPLIASAGTGISFARKSKANTHFALNAQGEMTNQRRVLEECAAILMELDCKLEVGLDNMWAKTGVELKPIGTRERSNPLSGPSTHLWNVRAGDLANRPISSLMADCASVVVRRFLMHAGVVVED